MKSLLKPLVQLLFALVISLYFVSTASAAENGLLDKLQGKWVCKKTEDGQKVTMTLEFKKDKLIFIVAGSGGDVTLYATGDVKLEKLGGFNIFTAHNIKAGNSSDSLDDVSEEYGHVLRLDGSTLYLAANMDKDREKAPIIDVFQKVAGSSK